MNERSMPSQANTPTMPQYANIIHCYGYVRKERSSGERELGRVDDDGRRLDSTNSLITNRLCGSDKECQLAGV